MLVNVHEQSQRNFNALSQLLLHAFCTLFLHFCVAGNYYILRNLLLSVRRCRQFSFCATQALKTVKKKKSEKKLNSFGELGVANRARKICHYRHVKAGSTFTYKFLNSLLLSAEKYGRAILQRLVVVGFVLHTNWCEFEKFSAILGACIKLQLHNFMRCETKMCELMKCVDNYAFVLRHNCYYVSN